MPTVAEIIETARRGGFELLSPVAEAVHGHLDAEEQMMCLVPVDYLFTADDTQPGDFHAAITDKRIFVYTYFMVWTGRIEFTDYPFSELTGNCGLREHRQDGVDYTQPWNQPYLQFSWELLSGAIHGVFLRNESRARTLESAFIQAFDALFPPNSGSTP